MRQRRHEAVVRPFVDLDRPVQAVGQDARQIGPALGRRDERAEAAGERRVDSKIAPAVGLVADDAMLGVEPLAVCQRGGREEGGECGRQDEAPHGGAAQTLPMSAAPVQW